MLSGETAAGKYPVEAVKTMATIAKRTEETVDYNKNLRNKELASTNVTDAISYATCTTAINLDAKAILTSTSSGHTARMVSKFRPSCPIVATTSNERVMRQLSLTWGVLPTLSTDGTNTDEVIANSMNAAKENNFVEENDLVVITAGVPVATSGTTNLVKVETI
jgi:pyruvate kinase